MSNEGIAEMSIRRVAMRATVPALVLLLAACAQPNAGQDAPSGGAETSTPPVASPVAPASDAPAASPPPSAAPEVLEHELPANARVTGDAIGVRAAPRADAPLISGERYSDMATVPNVEVAAGDLVIASLGPVFADGESWYQVRATDGGEMYWERGWVPGRYLVPEGEPTGLAPIVTVHGLGTGSAASAEVAVGTPVSVDFAAVPMPDREECEFALTLTGTDGEVLELVTETVTTATVGQITRDELPALFQEAAGSITLQAKTDCSWAAGMIVP